MRINNNINIFCCLSVTSLMLLLTVSFVYGQEKRFLLLKPATGVETVAVAEIDKSEKKSYITRSGSVTLAISELLAACEYVQNNSLTSGDQVKLILSFFTEQEIEIVLDSEKCTQNNYYLSGHIEGELSTFSITATQENYIVTFRDLAENKLYKVVGTMNSGKGKVTEIDLKKMEPVIHLPPRVSPKQ